MRRTAWDIDDQRAREKLCSLIDEYLIGPKSEKAREVLKLYMVDGKTYEPQSVTFSSSYSDITMGDSSSLISGFKGALSLMHWKGQKATVVFSSAHGYGASGSSNSNGFVIPPYEPLIFELEILQDEEAE